MALEGQTPVFKPDVPPATAGTATTAATSHRDARPDHIISPPAPGSFSPLARMPGQTTRASKASTPAERHAGLGSGITGDFQADTPGAPLLGDDGAPSYGATDAAAPPGHVAVTVAASAPAALAKDGEAEEKPAESGLTLGSRRGGSNASSTSSETDRLLGSAGQSARPSYFQRLKLLCYYPTQTLAATAYLLLIASRLLAASSYGAAAKAGANVLAQDFLGKEVDPIVQEAIFWLGTLSNGYFAYAAHSKKLVDTVKHIQDLWSEVSSARYKCDWRTVKLILVQISTAIYAALNGVSSQVSLSTFSDTLTEGVVGTAAGNYAAISLNFNAHYGAAALTETELLTAAQDVIEQARQIAADKITELTDAGNSYAFSLNQAKPLMRAHISRALENRAFAAQLEEIFGKKMDDRIKVGTEYKTFRETMEYMILTASIQDLKPVRKKVGYGVLSVSILSQAAYYVFFLQKLLANSNTWWAKALTYGAPALSTPSMYYAQKAAVVRAITDEKNPAAPLGTDYNPIKINRAGERSVHAVSSGMRIIADMATLLALCGSVLLLLKNFWSSEDTADKWARNIISLLCGLIAAYTYSVNNSQRGQRHNEELGPPLRGIIGITGETIRAFADTKGAVHSASAPRRESPAATDTASGMPHGRSASAPATGADKAGTGLHPRYTASAPAPASETDTTGRPRLPSMEMDKGDGLAELHRARSLSAGRRGSGAVADPSAGLTMFGLTRADSGRSNSVSGSLRTGDREGGIRTSGGR